MTPPPAPAPVAPPPAVATDNAARARQLVEEGRAAEKANDFQTALNRYSEAAQLDPNNQAAAAGQTQMMQLSGRTGTATTALDQVDRQIRARQQEIRYVRARD